MKRLLSLLLAGSLLLPQIVLAEDALPVSPQPFTRLAAITTISETLELTTPRLTKRQRGHMFYEDIDDSALQRVYPFCRSGGLNCLRSTFNPQGTMSKPAFFKVFFGAIHEQNPFIFPISYAYARDWSTPFMDTALRHGLIDSVEPHELSEADALEILRRYEALKEFRFATDIYFEGMVSTPEEVTIENYPTIQKVTTALEGYTRMSQNTRVPSDVANRIEEIRKALHRIETGMKMSPILFDASYTEEERAYFKEVGVKELIGEGYYDFRNNASYRKANVRNSLDNAHMHVMQPGEEFNYWNVMRNGGLSDIVSGWVISRGEEVWAWGGGLCGSATALFRAAWFAGLEITERKNHSIYYSSLYDRDLIGLDATVYSTNPNLRFKNNTGAPLIIYMRWNDTLDEAWVQVLGTKHFSALDSSGPYKAGSAYAHTRTIEYLDGQEGVDTVKSYYRRIY